MPSSFPPKILVISDYRDYHSTRPEVAIYLGLVRQGFEVTVMTYPEASWIAEFEAAGVRVVPWHPVRKFDRREVKKIREFLVENEIDILHLYNSVATVNGIRAARGLSVKVLLYRGYTGNIHWWDPTAYLKYLHPRVDKIVCNSQGVEELIRRQLFSRTDKPVTIHKGHDVRWYAGYEPYDLRKKFSLPANALVLVTVANNRRMKGIPHLLKAMTLLPEDLPVYLLLIGRDMDTTANLNLLKKSPAREKVIFTGFRNDVLNFVAGADAFVLPSVKGESLTKSVIEAMCLEVAPVITAIPGNRELVEHGKSGLVVEPGKATALRDAILWLFNNREAASELGRQARRRIETHFNTEQTVEKMAALYRELLDSGQGGA
jgi:glycosyltransferase involved in cell wall biosynthesis